MIAPSQLILKEPGQGVTRVGELGLVKETSRKDFEIDREID